MSFDVNEIRKDFPILEQTVNGRPLVYFDNAATTQKPRRVIDKIVEVYTQYNANVHRGVHTLSNRATTAMEESRKTVQAFINAESEREIIFTRGATESINLVANSLGQKYLSADSEVIVSEMEHHSNIVPWQLLENQGKTKVVKWAFDDRGELNLAELEELITDQTKLLAICYVSNTLGTINPIEQIIAIAHSHNVPVLVDASQAIQHFPIDVQQLDCDFLVFSGHKIYGPTGVGVLYGKEQWLNQMPPYQGGGEMIETVSFGGTTFNQLPYKFEAGTPNYVDIIGLGEALRYVNSIGLENIAAYENELLKYATDKIQTISELRQIGTAERRASVLSFVADCAHPFDIGSILDKLGIAVRTGTHCTEPIMQHFGIPGTVRASFAFYNKIEEIDVFYEGLKRAIKMFK
ncbi:MAG: SufS family cysteine desulfurase [Salinivirgaceae bacterium]|nr:SufS family cysteine desulfurase [Salinivirgaceae bacterium]